MLTPRLSETRGLTDLGWLRSRHTFSFGDYFDPTQLGFRALRVLNEDEVEPGQGSDRHSHRDVEILSLVLEGALEYEVDLGTRSVARPGDLHRLSAGSGIRHSERNHSPTESVRLLQIWIVPEHDGAEPSYERRRVPLTERRNRLRLLASGDGRGQSLRLNRDVDVYGSVLSPETSLSFALRAHRGAWLQVLRGAVCVGAPGHAPVELSAGDGIAAEAVGTLTLTQRGSEDTELLLFDLP